MSLACVHCRAIVGVDAPPVIVEVHLSSGLPSLAIVGLAETTVKESRERVRSALINSGFEFPQRRITINLAPADLPKDGGRFDLAIAIGILAASGQIPLEKLRQIELIAELGLSGETRSISGVLPSALACSKIERELFVSDKNADEAALVSDLTVFAVPNLASLVTHLNQKSILDKVKHSAYNDAYPLFYPDMKDVKGQSRARRALEIAAAGQHNLIMAGPPGSGKSMLAARLPGLLPPLPEHEWLEVAAVRSISGLPQDGFGMRPYRAPHHTASASALVGGGSYPRPGEISLAHRGSLFLDELPEFSRKVLEVLREPLENGEILISRANQQAKFPAKFQLIAAMNPCPCGFHNDGTDRCHCSPDQIRRYQQKVSGPLLDRIDIQLWINAVSKDEFIQENTQIESTATIQERVNRAFKRQMQRQGCANQQLTGAQLDEVAQLSPDDKRMLIDALEKLNLSARAYHRIIRVARTIADLKGDEAISKASLLEALSYRRGLLPSTSST